MSNVFNKELETALKGVYTQLENNELIQKNLEVGGKLALYYAHGATEKATYKLETDQALSTTTGQQLKVATNVSEICNNVVTAATAAATDAKNTNSAASTAAVNLQSAANQLTELSADVAAILAVATSKDYGSKLQKLVQVAFDLTRTAAEKAENTTLQSLDTTIEAAQSRASVALGQSKTLSTDMNALVSALNTNFATLQTTVTSDSEAVSTAVAAENEQDGIYKTAQQEEKAMTFSEQFINRYVNHNLKYHAIDQMGEQFTLSFNAFDEKALILVNGEEQDANVAKEYRILISTWDDAPSFDVHAAKASQNYFSLVPDGTGHYSQAFITAEYMAHLQNVKLAEDTDLVLPTTPVAKDYTGKAVQRGVPYVFFVYLVYTCDYQNEMNDTDGYLSLASLPFTLLTDLPAANRPAMSFYTYSDNKPTNCSSSPAVRVTFTVDAPKLKFHDVDLTQLMDFRVLIFNNKDRLASILNHYTAEQLEELATLDEEYRLSEEAYLVAQEAYNTAIATQSGNVNQLKVVMDGAYAKYLSMRSKYDLQQDVIEVLNDVKISNFFIDTEILEQIPEAFGMVAEINNELFVELSTRLKDYNNYQETLLAEQKVANTQLESLKKQEKTDKTALKRLNTELNKKQKEYDALLAEQDKEFRTLLNELEQTDEEINEFLDGVQNMDSLTEVVKIIDELKAEKEILKQLKDIAKKVDKLKKEIAVQELKIQEKTTGINALIEQEQPFLEQLEYLDGELKKISDQIKNLETEIKELESGTGNGDPVDEDLQNMQDTLAEMQKTLENMKENEDQDPESLASLEAEIADLEVEINKLKKDLGDPKSAKVRFVATNEKGNFTDNYGEPLVETETYTALVLSVIKDNQPEAQPLFQPVYSAFSKPLVYDIL